MIDLINNQTGIPVVVIAGKPNVGKSTLFNRLTGKRKAITDAAPGVTRDPVPDECILGDMKVRLIDTGGVNNSKSDIDVKVTEKSMGLVEKADLILFMVDIRNITPEDEFFIEKLRKFSKKIILVINKVDYPEKETETWNFYSYGFDKIVPISSAHGLNMDVLDDMVSEFLKENYNPVMTAEPEKDDSFIKIAILGKPNTGKSTLTNRLTGTEGSIVSDIPGTTRDVIEGYFTYKDINYFVMDTAGIRRKSRVSENVEYYSVTRAIKCIEDADIVFMIIDGEEGLSDQDKKIAGHVVKKGKGIILVINKWDKLKEVPNMMSAIEDRTRFLFPVLDFAPIVPISAKDGSGVDDLMKTAYKINRQLETRVSTSSLNKALRDWLEELAPPSGKNIKYKIKYMTQTSIKPTRFLMFVNKSKFFPESYQKYIKNKIRKTFGFSSIPFELDMKETINTWKEN